MRITPLDIRKQEFRRVVRGLDSDEVHAFLTTVADEYEAVLVDNKQLRERILDLDEKMSEYRNMERTLRDTLMTAERVLDEAKDSAKRESDLILKDAEMKAQQVTESLRRQSTELRREIVELHKEKDAYLARFKGLAEAQIQFIDNHQTDFEELDRRMLNLADSISSRVEPESARESEFAPSPRPQEPNRPTPESRPAFTPPPVASPPESRERPEPQLRSENHPAPAFQDRSDPQCESESRDEWRDYTPGKAVPRSAAPAWQDRSRESEERFPEQAAPDFSEETAEDHFPEESQEPEAEFDEAIPMDQQDNLLESEEVDQLLAPIHNAQSHPAEPDQDSSEPATAAVGSDRSENANHPKEKSRSWDMKSFTKDIGDA